MDNTTSIIIVFVILGILSILASAVFGIWWYMSPGSSPAPAPAPVVVLAPYTADFPDEVPAPSQSPSQQSPSPSESGYPFGGTEFFANFYTSGDEYEKNGTERISASSTKDECALAAKEKGKAMVWNTKTKECWAKHVTQSSIFVGQGVTKSTEWVTVTFDPYFQGKNIDSLT